jgi:hypothetical protein
MALPIDGISEKALRSYITVEGRMKINFARPSIIRLPGIRFCFARARN